MSTAAVAPLEEQAWRLNNLYSIKNKQGQVVRFRMNWAQQELFERLWCNNIVLKARQLGMSTLVQLMALDACLFNNDYAAAVIAHELDAAEDIFDRNVRTPYERLPESLRAAVGASRDSSKMLAFSNGSRIRVGVSMRAGTLQFLHVSEFGRICSKYPHKAREIVSGSLQAVGQGNIVVIESTAEGATGAFHDYCQRAISLREQDKRLTKLDYRLFFFPWWRESGYRMSKAEAMRTPIPPDKAEYFAQVEADIGQEISREQRAWWIKKWQDMQMDDALMMREYPATEAEAFAVSTEGAYYANQLAWLRKHRRIGRVPIEPSMPINTFWDLGVDDMTAIWLHQRLGAENRLVGYIEGFGEPLQYYTDKLWQYRKDGFTYGQHLMPHDARNRSLQTGKSLEDVARSLGVRPLQIVNTPDLLGGIQQTRDFLLTCWIDEEQCAQGLHRLQHYSKDWSEKIGWMDKPRHDEHSHGADALRIGAQGSAYLTGETAMSGLETATYLPEPEPDY